MKSYVVSNEKSSSILLQINYNEDNDRGSSHCIDGECNSLLLKGMDIQVLSLLPSY